MPEGRETPTVRHFAWSIHFWSINLGTIFSLSLSPMSYSLAPKDGSTSGDRNPTQRKREEGREREREREEKREREREREKAAPIAVENKRD